MPTILEKMGALRDEALDEMRFSAAFKAFIALDDAVVAMGGERLPITASLDSAVTAVSSIYSRMPRNPNGKRVSQGDAAAMVLEERGPTQGVDLLDAIPDKGGNVGGDKPMINLTSTMSKDPRFASIRRDGNYFWWFANRPLPENWNTGAGLDLGEEPAPVFAPSGSEGGDGHDPTTT